MWRFLKAPDARCRLARQCAGVFPQKKEISSPSLPDLPRLNSDEQRAAEFKFNVTIQQRRFKIDTIKAASSQTGVFKPMYLRKKHYLTLILASLDFLLLVTVGIFFKHAPRHQVTELESITARIPLGISTAEADAQLGRAPDAISQIRGTLLNSTTMLTADNPRSAQQGSVQLFTLRTWHRGDTHATIAVNQSGKVAGRWSWSDHPPARAFHLNPNEINNRVNALWQSLFG
ncbi:hypothetical protein [Gimesia sp.]|uniref:hypothetical protein n=1 Tax=Gimesia sp. TaxID=2024833 RepID=UPI003A9529EE